MEDSNDEIPEHPDGLPFPEDGIQAIEGPNGHQRVLGKAAKFIYAGFDEVAKIVMKTTHHDLGETERTYRVILRDEDGGIHLGGGNTAPTAGDVSWIDLYYGWEDALAAVDDFIAHTAESVEHETTEVVEGAEAYEQLRAQMN